WRRPESNPPGTATRSAMAQRRAAAPIPPSRPAGREPAAPPPGLPPRGGGGLGLGSPVPVRGQLGAPSSSAPPLVAASSGRSWQFASWLGGIPGFYPAL